MASKVGSCLLRQRVCCKCQPYSTAERHGFSSIASGASLQLRFSSTTSSQSSKSSLQPGYYPPPEHLHKSAFTLLTDRSLIRLQGPDVVSFLNGLLPSRIQPLPNTTSAPTFTAFLTAKGRLLYDVFVYPPAESDSEGPWYLEVESSSASALLSHLKKHKLRSKFKLEKISPEEAGVIYVWPGYDEAGLTTAGVGGRDPRPLMGSRFITPTNDSSSFLASLKDTAYAASVNDYKIHRMLTGHAEGSQELIPNSALPQESNLDFLQGIDFHKGCYLGQELTIRTHHTGVVRKRILPCQISTTPISSDSVVPRYDSSLSIPTPPHESNISKVRATGRAGRSTGKWLGGVGNVGLALCRLEMMTDVELTAEGTTHDPDDKFAIIWENDESDSDGKTTVQEVFVRPFVPVWLQQNIQAGIQARTDRGRRKRQELDDEDLE